MADTDETPAQRQARIRREKREAKIKGSAQDRLDKITQLSGRTPESMRRESPVSTPPRVTSPAISADPASQTGAADPEEVNLQEFLRTQLRQQNAQQPGQQGANPNEDPMMKMIQDMMAGMSGDPNATGMPSLNPDDIAKATGLPSFVTNMVLGKQDAPTSPAQQKEQRMWGLLHIVFAFIAGIYLLLTVDTSTTTFGTNPPAPATFRNPFVAFVMGELLLQGSRTVLSSTPRKSGPMQWWQTAKGIGRDAAVMVFMMGVYSWWNGLA